MNITISVTATFASRMRNVRLEIRWVGWILRLIGVGYLIWWVTDPYELSWPIFAVIFLLFPELLGVIRHVISRRFGRVYTYALTDDGVRIRTAITNLEFDWSAVTSIRPVRAGWVIKLPAGGGFVLPNNAMTPDQTTEWQAFLSARSVTPA